MLYITKCIRLIKPVNTMVGKFVPVARHINIFPSKMECELSRHTAAIKSNVCSLLENSEKQSSQTLNRLSVANLFNLMLKFKSEGPFGKRKLCPLTATYTSSRQEVSKMKSIPVSAIFCLHEAKWFTHLLKTSQQNDCCCNWLPVD